MADCGYAFVRSLAPDLAAGAGLVVRMNWQNLPLEDEHGERREVVAWLRQAFAYPVSGPQETYVRLTTSQGRYRLRLLPLPYPRKPPTEPVSALARQLRKRGVPRTNAPCSPLALSCS